MLFFLVAALISLTTMTRMVEEQRTQIGTLKALGYERHSIAGKYIGYACLATVSGSAFGILVGEKILPYIIITAYGIMYQHIDTVLTPYNMYYGLAASLAALACTLLATIFSCFHELREQAAELMRPPTPKQGKRVFMERIPFLWKRLSFIWKATVRNLIRYKKRFFMTVFGIGGCMALLLVGFGLKDSIFDIAVLQYGEIQLYDGNVILEEDASAEDVNLLKPSSFSPVLAIIGVVCIMFVKKQKVQDIGKILVGFAILMTGMDAMSSAVEPLADVPQFTQILTMFSNPVLGMLAGLVLTAIIQSSSASVGILQALCSTGSLGFATVIPIIMGQNIGTCVTLPARHTGKVSAPSAQNAPRIPCTGPKPRSAARTNRVRNAPESPTAPPMTPVASPLRPAYHFWAQDWIEGYKKAVPSPAGMLKARKNPHPALPGRKAAAKKPPQSRAVPHNAAQRGPFLSCKKPPSTHPTPKAAMSKAKA